ncbi:MAG TPA: hypothetical protein VFS86_04225 [Rhodanobacteraceae bacterium]|nr:hypothetical protein [Rhodanobacteraceae bacterium]
MLAVAAGWAVLAAVPAIARPTHVFLGINLGGPFAPAPVVYAPPMAYAAPTYYAPAPAYYVPRVYYGPGRYQHDHRGWYRHRDWRGHDRHWRDDDDDDR